VGIVISAGPKTQMRKSRNVYNVYTGASAFSEQSYNPYTGTYRADRTSYNPYTGTVRSSSVTDQLRRW